PAPGPASSVVPRAALSLTWAGRPWWGGGRGRRRGHGAQGWRPRARVHPAACGRRPRLALRLPRGHGGAGLPALPRLTGLRRAPAAVAPPTGCLPRAGRPDLGDRLRRARASRALRSGAVVGRAPVDRPRAPRLSRLRTRARRALALPAPAGVP